MRRVTGYKDYTTREGDTFDANVALRLPIVEGAETPETLPPWRRDSEDEDDSA